MSVGRGSAGTRRMGVRGVGSWEAQLEGWRTLWTKCKGCDLLDVRMSSS